MLHTEEMTKVLFAGTDNYLKAVIEKLYSMGVIHLKNHKSSEEIDIGAPLEDASSLSETIVKLRSIASYLNIDFKKETKTKSKKTLEINLNEINSEVQQLNSEILSTQDRLKEIEDSLRLKKSEIPELTYLSRLKIPFEMLSDVQALDVFIGVISKPSGFSDTLKNVTKRFELISAEIEKENKLVIALFSDKSSNAQILNILQKHGFSAIDIKKYIGSEKPNVLLGKINAEIKELEFEKEKLSKKFPELKQKWSDYIIHAEKILSEELEKAEAPLRFGKTKDSFIISGYVPEKIFEKVSGELKKITKDKIYIKKLSIGEEEHVPAKLHNPKLVNSFEFFMHLYGLPNQQEIDPTFFIFLTFPIFFGFMLGDIGYGAVSLIFFWLMKKAMPKVGFFFNILMLASLFSIIFGFVFGEVFGFEQLGAVEIPRLLSRNPAHSLYPLMIAAGIIGAIHVNIGVLVGFANELHHGLVKAILAKGAWLVLEAGVALMVLSMMKIIPLSIYVGAGVLLLSVVMLTFGEGFRGIIEIPALFGSMLSYLRLMAIGLSSVGLALVINDLAGQFFKDGLTWLIIPGILILIVGHVLNIAIGILGSFLHSLRLHYVEFFTKFYKGGGIPYVPFGHVK